MSNELIRVNDPEVAVVVDFGRLCLPSLPSLASPIDEYYDRSKAVILASVAADDWLLRLLLLDLISAAESYFRRTLSGAINACRLSRGIASSQTVSLGAVDYYGLPDLGFGILENAALSGTSELKKKTRALTGLEVKEGSSVDVALGGFDRICQLRHAAVHAKGELGSRNLTELGLQANERRSLRLTALNFQPLALQCQSAVRAFNQFLFSGILRRWIEHDTLVGDWSADGPVFEKLLALFGSKSDAPSLDARSAYTTILTAVTARKAKRQ